MGRDFSKVESRGLDRARPQALSSVLCAHGIPAVRGPVFDHSKHCSRKLSQQMNCLSKWPWDSEGASVNASLGVKGLGRYWDSAETLVPWLERLESGVFTLLGRRLLGKMCKITEIIETGPLFPSEGSGRLIVNPGQRETGSYRNLVPLFLSVLLPLSCFCLL